MTHDEQRDDPLAAYEARLLKLRSRINDLKVSVDPQTRLGIQLNRWLRNLSDTTRVLLAEVQGALAAHVPPTQVMPEAMNFCCNEVETQFDELEKQINLHRDAADDS